MTLYEAVAHTREAETFHVRATISIVGYEEIANIDYVAPDRFRMVVQRKGVTSETIVIGNDVYGSDPRSPGLFVRIERDTVSPMQLLPALAIDEFAGDVTLTGTTYRFAVLDSVGQHVGEGEAQVENGFLAFVGLRSGEVEQRFVFSAFGADVFIERPSPDQIADGAVSLDSGFPWIPPTLPGG